MKDNYKINIVSRTVDIFFLVFDTIGDIFDKSLGLGSLLFTLYRVPCSFEVRLCASATPPVWLMRPAWAETATVEVFSCYCIVSIVYCLLITCIYISLHH